MSLSKFRTAAMCLLAYAAFLRFNELAELRCKDVITNDSYLELHIRSSKTDQYRQGSKLAIA